METTAMYHFQASIDPYSKYGEGYICEANMTEIMDAYTEYINDKEEN